MKKVSVIIPNMDGKHFLEKCLGSLAGVSFDDTEIIVVDNASKDGSRQWIKEEHPEEFKGFFENTDGSVYAKFPLKWVKITPPRAGRTLTEEEKEEVRKRLADARNKKGTKNE